MFYWQTSVFSLHCVEELRIRTKRGPQLFMWGYKTGKKATGRLTFNLVYLKRYVGKTIRIKTCVRDGLILNIFVNFLI